MKHSFAPALEEVSLEAKEALFSANAVDLVSLKQNHKGGREGRMFLQFNSKNAFVDQEASPALLRETALFLSKVSNKTLYLWPESAVDTYFLISQSQCFFSYVTPSDLEGGFLFS